MIANDILAGDIGAQNMHYRMFTVKQFNDMFKADLKIDKDGKKMGMAELTEELSEMCKTNDLLNKFVNDHNAFVIEKAQQELEEQIRNYKQQDGNDVDLYDIKNTFYK